MDTYLTSISLYMNEKTELLEHIKRNINGTFIDIGTGGDAVAVMVKDLPKTAYTHLIAADIDPLVLSSIKTRRPEIVEYIESKTGPKVELVAMCATNMNPIKDSSISGIGASALMHEVFSYVPSKSSIDQFVNELCRVLEKDGVFIYRDPKWVNDPLVHCIMIIKNDIGKYYTALFLTKFLDRQFSCQRDYKNDCSKPNIYKATDIKFNVFFKNTNEPKQLNYEEFVFTPAAAIDFSKNFSIEAPKGLIAEIQRHYLMFLRNDFIPGFLDPQLFTTDLNLADLSKDERIMMKDFCLRKAIPIIDDVIKKEQFSAVFLEYKKLSDLFRRPLEINLDKNAELGSLIQRYVEEDKISRNLLYLLNPETAVIDVKLLALLFQGKEKGIFKYLSQNEQMPLGILEHLKLEGEEHYFYKTTDQLITYFGQYSSHILKNTHKHGFLLAPIDSKYVKEIKRDYYRSVLKRNMHVIDQYGNIQEPVTEKNIIHFKLQPLNRSLAIYEKLLEEQPHIYVSLNKWVQELKKQNSE